MFSSLKTWSVLAGFSVVVVLVAAPVMAHGHAKHSVDCIFEMKGVQVEIRDVVDGVILTMTSEDEEVIAKLQEQAWGQVEPEEGTREHDCFLHMASAQVLVEEVQDGVVLTITSTDDETVSKLQEMARSATKKGCRHHGHDEAHR